MRTIRIYHPHPLKCGDSVSLSSTATHHLLHVLRVKVGAAIILFNGDGGQFKAEISTISKQCINATVKQFDDIEVESPINLMLGQAIAKGERMDWTIQKAVELGVNTISPLISQHCAIKLNRQHQQKRHTHWQRIVENACEQCGRNRLPTVNPPLALHDWLHNLPSASHRLLLDPNSDLPLSKALTEKFTDINTPIILLIGPEGGLNDQEITLAKQANFIAVKAGKRVLRTETAAITTLAAMQTLYGDL